MFTLNMQEMNFIEDDIDLFIGAVYCTQSPLDRWENKAA